MAQIKEYKLLVASTPEKLAEQMKPYLERGWQPFQSPSMFQISPSAMNVQLAFIQAIIKY